MGKLIPYDLRQRRDTYPRFSCSPWEARIMYPQGEYLEEVAWPGSSWYMENTFSSRVLGTFIIERTGPHTMYSSVLDWEYHLHDVFHSG